MKAALIVAIAMVTTLPVQAADLTAVRAAGVLRVGTTGDYKPFAFREQDGSYRGADIVMAQQLAAELGVKIQFVPTVWAKLNDDFAAGKFDIAVGGVTILPAREKIAAFFHGDLGGRQAPHHALRRQGPLHLGRRDRPALGAGRGEPRCIERGFRPQPTFRTPS